MTTKYQTFLSYNSKDFECTSELASILKDNEISVWFDKWLLRPGMPWQEEMEDGLINSSSIIVCIGKHGFGPWEIPEMRVGISEHINRKMPVIPLLLPNCDITPELPIFLRRFTWIDLRNGFSDIEGLENLLWGITGEKKKIRKIKTPERSKEQTILTYDYLILNQDNQYTKNIINIIKSISVKENKKTEIISNIYAEFPLISADKLADAVFNATYVFLILNNDSPYIPINIQSGSIAPDKKVLLIHDKEFSIPDFLTVNEAFSYRDSKSGLDSLNKSLQYFFESEGNPLSIQKSIELKNLGHYNASIIQMSSFIEHYLREMALEKFGHKYFKTKPLRYYTLSELFNFLMKNKKLRLRKDNVYINWKRIIRLRNDAIHRPLENDSNQNNCEWFQKEIENLLKINA